MVIPSPFQYIQFQKETNHLQEFVVRKFAATTSNFDILVDRQDKNYM